MNRVWPVIVRTRERQLERLATAVTEARAHRDRCAAHADTLAHEAQSLAEEAGRTAQRLQRQPALALDAFARIQTYLWRLRGRIATHREARARADETLRDAQARLDTAAGRWAALRTRIDRLREMQRRQARQSQRRREARRDAERAELHVLRIGHDG